MEKTTAYVSLPVINVSNAKMEGIILNVYFNKRLSALVGFTVLSETQETEELSIVPIKSVKSVTYQSVTVDGVGGELADAVPSPVAKPCYDTDGNYLGRVREIYLNVKNRQVTGVLVDEVLYPKGKLYYCSEQLLLIKGKGMISRKKPQTAVAKGGEEVETDGRNRPGVKGAESTAKDNGEEAEKDSRNRPGVKGVVDAAKVSSEEAETDGRNRPGVKGMERQEKNTPYSQNTAYVSQDFMKNRNVRQLATATLARYRSDGPATAKTDCSFLLGKRLPYNLYAHDKTLLAENGVILTPSLLALIRENGKLAELLLYFIARG